MEGTGQREEYVYQPSRLTSPLLVSPTENPRGSQRMKELIEIVHRGHTLGAENRVEIKLGGQRDFQLIHLTHIETELMRDEVICPMSHG